MPKKDSCNISLKALQVINKYIALFVGIGLIAASLLIIYHSFSELYIGNTDEAIQDGLFVLILLEMFYVVSSFIKYNSINVGLIVNVGIIAAVKELVFQFRDLDMKLAIGFSVVFLSLGALYWMEGFYYKQHKEEAREMLRAIEE